MSENKNVVVCGIPMGTGNGSNFNEDTVRQIRCLLSNVYDLQKLRISAGNRIVTSFYIKLGIKPSESPDSADAEALKLITALKNEYKRVSAETLRDNVFDNENGAVKMRSNQITKAIDTLNKDKPLKYIRDSADYNLMTSYMMLVDSEEQATKVLKGYVESHPMWDAFFKHVSGCGTLMAACCLAYLDPYKARHASCFIRYCGLDTVRNVDEFGNLVSFTKDGRFKHVREKYDYVYRDTGAKYTGKVHETLVEIIDRGRPTEQKLYEYTASDGCILDKVLRTGVDENGNDAICYEYINEEDAQEAIEKYGENIYIGDTAPLEHGRRMGDTTEVEYVDSKGNKQWKRSITYNPIIKSKLIGVLADCIIKASGDKAESEEYITTASGKQRKSKPFQRVTGDFHDKGHYRWDVFEPYMTRLDNSAYHKDKSKPEKYRMAKRYMIKQFLKDLWSAWRFNEGLEVTVSYPEAKLGHNPHKDGEELQHKLAMAWQEYNKA